MNPLDSGPQNVLGKRPTLVDPLVLELISRIEPLISHKDIEFEGRLGCLCAPSMDKKTAARIHLPITTEVMVEPSGSTADLNGKPFKFEFVPDLGKEAFEKNSATTRISAGRKTASVQQPSQPFVQG